MDPDAALRRLLDACSDHDNEEARQALKDLQQWLWRGGFLPEVETGTWDVTNGWQTFRVRRKIG